LRERSFSVCVCFVMALSAQAPGRGRRAFSFQFHGWDDRDMGHISLLGASFSGCRCLQRPWKEPNLASRWIVADIETLALSADANVMIYQV
jgi:hypothetical protein